MHNKLLRSKVNICITLLIFFNIGCKKYLDLKPDKKLAVPSTIADLQSILDNSSFMNIYSWGIGESSADNYYLSVEDWESMSDEMDRNTYVWSDEVVGKFTNDWSTIYKSVYFSNIVLDNIDKVALAGHDISEKYNVKGSALFFRSFYFYRIATTFSLSFDEKSSDIDLGIPLRLNSDFNIKSVRSSVRQTYLQIVNDLRKAAQILPSYPSHVLRPSKGAAYGLLARVYLSMRKYKMAGLYADSCLQLNRHLINFNDLDSNLNFPISMFNIETIFYSSGGQANLFNTRARIDSNLYRSYGINDLRKIIYFNENKDGSHGFFGSYTANMGLFLGIATDEQYLIKAECLARSNKIDDAMSTINKLLITRWKNGTFVPLKAHNEKEALKIILIERRKELLMRDLRWADIKRLNLEGENISLKRVLGTKSFILLPNSPKFALPLPAYIIKMTGMRQNPR